jgi:hypothetical protein
MSESAGWVRACQSPVVPGTNVHAMALTPVILWTVWWSWFTFALTLAVAALFVVLEIKGRRPGWIIARQRSRLRGQKVLANPYWYLRRRSRIESYADLQISQAWGAPAAAAPDKHASRRVSAPTKS